MTRVSLLRHGESELNAHAPERVNGRSNFARLTPLGATQARLAGRWMHHHEFRPQIAVSSTALRTRLTMAHVAGEMGLIIPTIQEPAIQELSRGVAEGKIWADLLTPDVVAAIEADPFGFKFDGGESIRDVQARMTNWFWRTHDAFPSQHILVSGHGLAIRCLVGSILGLSAHDILNGLTTPNASLTEITVQDGHVDVISVGRDIVREQLANRSS